MGHALARSLALPASRSHVELRNVWGLFISNLAASPLPIFFSLEAKDELLNPENDTIGVLVSTAVEITVGGKTIKPAGETANPAPC